MGKDKTIAAPVEEMEVVEAKKVETFKVVKPFTLDKKYHQGQSVTLSEESTKKYLLTNKFIK